MNECHALIRELLQATQETVDTLLQLADADLDASCSHGCAMGGGIRRLLAHNADHDLEHAAAIARARHSAGNVQESELAGRVVDLMHRRVDLIGQLLGLPDEALEWQAKGDEWDIRKHVEHVLYWERDSMKTVREEQGLSK